MTNPKDLAGSKKVPYRFVPPALKEYAAYALADGAVKYDPFNWLDKPIDISFYLEAIERHVDAIKQGQWLDPKSGKPHIAHIIAGAGVVADAVERGELKNYLIKGLDPIKLEQLGLDTTRKQSAEFDFLAALDPKTYKKPVDVIDAHPTNPTCMICGARSGECLHTAWKKDPPLTIDNPIIPSNRVQDGRKTTA